MKTDDEDTVRWTIFAPKETDVSLRTHLARTGLKRGSLSKFVAEAVAWRLFDLNVSASKAHNRDVPSDVIEDEIEQALSQVRAKRFTKRA